MVMIFRNSVRIQFVVGLGSIPASCFGKNHFELTFQLLEVYCMSLGENAESAVERFDTMHDT